jgi:hypothetical protein
MIFAVVRQLSISKESRKTNQNAIEYKLKAFLIHEKENENQTPFSCFQVLIKNLLKLSRMFLEAFVV